MFWAGSVGTAAGGCRNLGLGGGCGGLGVRDGRVGGEVGLGVVLS